MDGVFTRRKAGYGYKHTASFCRFQQGAQMRAQSKMAQMVHTELEFESIFGFHAPRRGHDPGIIDLKINPVCQRANSPRTFRHGAEGGQIKREQGHIRLGAVRAQAVQGILPFFGVADW
ncbi:hypothetical protein AA19596_0179 [Acetobacter fabarum DSM 19596]|nr:hypothetical protein AA19596_0179 [Acetobacter fabarum DSM 19596]